MLTTNISSGQKRFIDTSDFGTWPRLEIGGAQISYNAKYVTYTISNMPRGKSTQIIQSVDGKWKKEIVADNGVFSPDAKWAIITQNDTLKLIKLGEDSIKELTHIRKHFFVQVSNLVYIIYLTQDNHLICNNLTNNDMLELPDANDFYLNKDNDAIITQFNSKDGKDQSALCLLHIKNKKIVPLWQGTPRILNAISDPQGSDLLCTLRQITRTDTIYKVIWADPSIDSNPKELFQSSSAITSLQFAPQSAQILFFCSDTIWRCSSKNSSPTAIPILEMSPVKDKWAFSTNILTIGQEGKTILFRLKPKNLSLSNRDSIKEIAHIWRSEDTHISLNSKVTNFDPSCLFSYNIEKNKIFQIEQVGESQLTRQPSKKKRYALIVRNAQQEWWWQKSQRSTITLVDLTNGQRNLFSKEVFETNRDIYQLSPNEKFIIYYDQHSRSFKSFDIAHQVTIDITSSVSTTWEYEHEWASYADPLFGYSRVPVGLAGWINGDSSILIYDKYHDIWKVDPSGKRKAINITRHYARRQKISFIIKCDVSGRYIGINLSRTLSDKDTIIALGINQETMESGYYLIFPGIDKDPVLLSKGKYMAAATTFQKVDSANVWLLGKASNNDAFNLYLVDNNWKNEIKITDLQPQSRYHWYTSTLLTWKKNNGNWSHAALFTPEKIDSARKYPIIFTYYERLSGAIFDYEQPEWASSASVNIPYFTSHGYTVCLIDIDYEPGHPGESALKSIKFAVDAIKKLSYIDTLRMGIIGHSWGGFETNYIVSHTSIFSCAVEGAGPSDLISGYGSLFASEPAHWLYEVGQSRIGKTLWGGQSLYLENSPVLFANKVKTPILILHNPMDVAVPFSQGLEWFNALRRLSKPAWMLQYPNEGHLLENPDASRDFTIKEFQFFNHFLKNEKKPKWMLSEKNP